MADYTPIPIPWSQHWRQFRMRLLPVLVFLVALGAVATLWERDAAPGFIVGEVHAPATMVNSPRAGWIEGETLVMHRQVEAGEEIAIVRIIPPDHARLALAVLHEEIRMIRLGVGDPIIDQQRNQLSWQGLRRDWMLVRSDVASLQVRMLQAETDMKRFESLVTRGADTQSNYEQARALFNSLKAEIEEKTRLAAELETAVSAARSVSSETEGLDLAVGIAAALDWKEAELRRLEAEIAPLSIVSPLAGKVTEIFHHPGDFVNLGDPVIEVRSDQAEFVIAYLKPPLAFQPEPGMEVEVVSRRGTRAIAGRATVLDIGPQFGLLPPVFQRPLPVTIEERALPARISLPETMSLMPGELVEIRQPRRP